MPTESSVVSDLIRSVSTRRLDSEPGDAFLFQSAPVATTSRAQRQPAPVARAPRVQRQVAPSFAAAPSSAPVTEERTRPRYPQATRSARTWPWIIATIFVGFAGVAAAAYFFPFNDDERAPRPTAVAPVAAPAAAAQPAAAEQPVAVVAQPTEVPAVATPAAPVDTAVANPMPTNKKPVTKHRATHSKAKRIAKKHAAPSKQPATPTIESAPPPPPPAAPAASPPRKAEQHSDSENPL